ncbi:Hypothetical predicted protein [Cloeon dipterum]|uniref:Cullin N-terminal domain-containing protein n=1 Tax=Cloeon dipterum TaxID=197152 RepID=A0A8S1DND3_9INSE|nr:Hypothetical predicted protein [Cloeon dipterum]
MLEPIGCEITSVLWNTIKNEENEMAIVQEVVLSFEQVDAVDLFEKLFFEILGEYCKSRRIEWFQGLTVTEFIEKVLQMMENEVEWGQKFLPESSIANMRSIFIEKATAKSMDEMMKECQQMFKENRKDELKKLYKILDILPAERKRIDQGRLSATWQITARNEALDSTYLIMESIKRLFAATLVARNFERTSRVDCVHYTQEIWQDFPKACRKWIMRPLNATSVYMENSCRKNYLRLGVKNCFIY